jgi:hypothetical protein
LGERRGQPVAELVRDAVDAWLESQGVRVVDEDEWKSRFEQLVARRRQIAEEREWSTEQVERDVSLAIAEARRTRRARRR